MTHTFITKFYDGQDTGQGGGGVNELPGTREYEAQAFHRVLQWWQEGMKQKANTAFTAGLDRTMAQLIETVLTGYSQEKLEKAAAEYAAKEYFFHIAYRSFIAGAAFNWKYLK